MPVKKSGLGLQYPVTPNNEKELSLLHVRSELFGYVTGEIPFQPPITFWNQGKKGVTKKYRMMPITPISRDYLRTLKHLTTVSYYAPKTQVSV